MPLAAGTRLGPYKIVAPLGAGGMGEVYRAQDTRLGRDVAVKVLPPHIAATPDGRARFEREARTISQLNHPNICTLYDVGHQDGVDYLVMELLEGETLAHRLDKGPLPLTEVLSIGKQIAEALDRAHRQGVVHRDLKPGNVMLTRGGAKLLDFGLAVAVRRAAGTGAMSHSPTMSGPLTAVGSIVGTFQYMAPEQLEGKDADARADIWALGCVLYEMTTGATAFAGESEASLIAAIMTGQPRPISEIRPVSPPGLDRLIRRCLQKSPDERVQAALDAAFMLAAVGLENPATAEAAQSRRIPAWLMATAAMAIAAASFMTGRLTVSPPEHGSIRVSTLSQGSRDNWPAVSPDGRLVAFGAVRQNGPGIWVMDMVTRSELKLTSGGDQQPRFTADGGNIVFTRVVGGHLSLWRVPVIGGKPRLLLEDAFDADPSPDGAQMAYISGQSDSTGQPTRLMISKSDGTSGRDLWTGSKSVLPSSPRWSPDGKRIVFVTSATQNSPNMAQVLDVSSGKVREFPAPNRAVLSNPIWDAAGDGLIVAEGVGVTAVQRAASARLFRLDTRSGRYQPLGWLENFPAIMDALPDGRLVLSSLLVRQNLYEVATDSRALSEGRWLTSGLAMDRQPVYSPDGKSVMFSSNRGGTLDLWEVSVETGEMHRVTDDPADDWDPEYGPDGQSIFWCSGRSGDFEIWTARRDGSAPRQLSRDSLDAENPSISSDGRWVLYSSAHPAKSGLWRLPVAGGEGEWLLKTGSLIPDLSPDDRYVSVITEVGTTGSKLSVFDRQEGKTLPHPVPLQPLPGTVQMGRSRITPDGNSVVYLSTRGDGQPIMVRRPLSAWRTGTGTIDTLFAGATDAIESFGLSPDGRRATVSVVDWLSGLTITEPVPGFVPARGRK